MENRYLIIEYKETKEQPTLRQTYTEKELFTIIDAAKEDERKIAVYKIGECLLDWSY